MKTILSLAFAIGIAASAIAGTEAPVSPLYVTNRSAAQLTARLAASGVLTNGGPGDGGGLTNVHVSGTIRVPFTGWAPTVGNSELIGTGSYNLLYGGGFIEFGTNSYTLTNIQCVIGGQSSSTQAFLKVFSLASWVNAFNVWTNTPLIDTTVTLPQWSGAPINIAVPATAIPNGSYIAAVFLSATTNDHAVKFAYFDHDAGNTNLPRLAFPLVVNVNGVTQPASPASSFGTAGYRLTGYVDAPAGSVTNAVNLVADKTVNGLLSDNTQGQLDQLATNAVPVDGYLNRQTLNDWDSRIGWWTMGSESNMNIVFIGDSWGTWGRNLTVCLDHALKGVFGSAGMGWVHGVSASTAPPGITRVITGTWHDDTPFTNGPSLGLITSTTAGDTWAVTGPMATNVIYYLVQPGGGNWAYDVDGGTPITNSANGSLALATLPIGNLGGASHTITIRVVTGTISLFGCDVQLSTPGVRIDNLAVSGTTAANWTNAFGAYFTAGISNLNPSVAIIQLGVNDQTGSLDPNTYASNVVAIADTIVAAATNSGIVLAAPGETGRANTYSMPQYRDALKGASLAHNWGFVDGMAVIGTNYDAANARGLYVNTTHLTDTGNQMLGQNLFRFLTKGNPGTNSLGYGSVNGAGITNLNASSISSGVLSDSLLSTNVVINQRMFQGFVPFVVPSKASPAGKFVMFGGYGDAADTARLMPVVGPVSLGNFIVQDSSAMSAGTNFTIYLVTNSVVCSNWPAVTVTGGSRATNTAWITLPSTVTNLCWVFYANSSPDVAFYFRHSMFWLMH